MFRLAGVILPQKKHIVVALRSIFGIGHTRAIKICEKVNVDPTVKVSDLTEDFKTLITQAVNEYEIEGDLRREIGMNIKRLQDIKCYRGLRHRKGLPVRGQNTKNNARTRKGRKSSKGSKSGSK